MEKKDKPNLNLPKLHLTLHGITWFILLLFCVSTLTITTLTYLDTQELKKEERMVYVALKNDKSFMMKPAEEGIYEAMYFYGIREDDMNIVYAQAVLETQLGNTCSNNNLFGITHKKGLVVYDYWFDSVKAYYEEIYYKYDPEKYKDYYEFLMHIPPYNKPYASDPNYIGKVKYIVSQINKEK